jgi:lipoic acid synthetase
MILGNVCTRSCGFCDVETGRPGAVDEDEPERVALVLSQLNLRHTVITSVDRDDLKDGGSTIWARTLEAARRLCPWMTLEALIGDFKGREADLDRVFGARPEILAHNLETVPRLNRKVRPQATYARSLAVISRAKSQGLQTKSGLMLGLGETLEEVQEVMRDLQSAGCDLLTLGQYLRPSPAHLPVERYVEPSEFQGLKAYGEMLGFRHVESGPLVRSSYHADRQAAAEFEVL